MFKSKLFLGLMVAILVALLVTQLVGPAASAGSVEAAEQGDSAQHAQSSSPYHDEPVSISNGGGSMCLPK